MKLDFSEFDHYFDLDKILNFICIIIAIIIFLLVAYGCSTSKIQNQPLKTFVITKTSQDDLEQKFQEVIDYCMPRLQAYEEKAMSQSNKSFWLNWSGLLSGAVLAPMIIASGSTGTWPLMIVAGLSGYAGSIPFASDALRASGHSGEAVARMRNEIVERIREKSIVALDGTRSYDERRNAIMGIVGDCTIYPMVIPKINE